MIYYLINHILCTPGNELPNPFVDFQYDLIVSIIFELVIFFISKWSAKVLASKFRNDHLKTMAIIPFFIVYYAITWLCMFIRPWELGFGLAIGIITALIVIMYIIIEKILAKRPFDIDHE